MHPPARKAIQGDKRSERGFTLVELMVVVAVIGVLATLAVPLYTNIQARGRLAKAQADSRTLASAVSVYGTHMGRIPSALTQLTTVATNAQGLSAGPFVASLPAAPGGWAAYTYTANTAAGTFTITTSGDGTTVRIP